MLQLRDVSLNLGNRTLIKPFSLSIPAGEIVTLMGASGSGKSSLLDFIGGNLAPVFQAAGDITLNGVAMNGVVAERRGIGRLFQDDLLFPHLTVGENLMFGIGRGNRSEREAMMRIALKRAELEGYEDRPPHTLSGGQRARVGLMRSLLAKPAAILLDEPFNKLDRSLRSSIRDYTFGHIRARQIPALLVTHDASDAPAGSRVLEIGPEGSISDV